MVVVGVVVAAAAAAAAPAVVRWWWWRGQRRWWQGWRRWCDGVIKRKGKGKGKGKVKAAKKEVAKVLTRCMCEARSVVVAEAKYEGGGPRAQAPSSRSAHARSAHGNLNKFINYKRRLTAHLSGSSAEHPLLYAI